MDFPVFKTKIEGKDQKFNLTDAKERRDYFLAKAGEEIENSRVTSRTTLSLFIFWARRIPARGTYSKMLAELLGSRLAGAFFRGRYDSRGVARHSGPGQKIGIGALFGKKLSRLDAAR